MAVKKDDIDFSKAFDKAAGTTKPNAAKPNKAPITEEDATFSKAFDNSLKKKDTGTESTPPSNVPPAGAAPGTTSTTPIKWDDNPLNPVKAATDYEEKRDKTPDILFKDADQEKLSGLLTKHNVAPASPVTKPLSWIENPAQTTIPQPQVKSQMQVEYDNAVNLETTLKAQLDNYRISRQGQKASRKSDQETEVENDLQEAQNLKRKAATELVVNGDKEIEVNQRTNEIGNSFNQFMSDLISLNQPIKGKRINIKETEDKLRKMPTQFLTGVNMLKLTEPAEYERVTEAIANGLPVSASQTAKITALGLNLEEAKLQRDILKSPVTKQERQKFDEIGKTLNTIKPDIDKYEEMIKAKQPLSPAQVQDYQNKIQQYNSTVTQSKPLIEKINAIDGAFSKKAAELQKARKENLIDNPEVLRSFIADGVATKLDELGKIKQGVGKAEKQVADFMFGHTWNYSPEQIKWASEQYLKEQGIDPNTPQAQSAIKFLQDNEGVMIGENSIAKAGGFRELGEGLISPITGTAKSIKDIYRSSNDVYAESQSQGNVDVAKKRLASEDTGVRGVVNDVLQGAGQFASQAAIMYATSGGIGAISEGILGKSGVQWLADAKAAGIKPVAAFDDATANLAAGKFLYGIKDPLSVFTTSYAMAYDGNLKAALSYTSDNTLAKRAAAFNASMEGATELFLSPLEIAEGIIHKFSKNQTKDILKILSDKSLKNDPSALKEYVGKFVKGVLGTAKVSGAEIGEELVTQISDYVTNMYLNPESDSFKNRDLKKELMQTAYQTGLSMAVPAVMNGIGAMRANSFSKGSLMVAAQNRQAIVDNLNTDLSEGRISQEQFNQRSQLVNTAAVANAQLPTKANGVQMDTNEKANYIWSRTTEAYMEKKLSTVTDKAEEEIWREKIKQQQEYRKQILGITEKEPEVPEYTIDDKPVDRKEFLETAEAQPDDHNYVVTGDEEAQQVIRQIGGIDDKVAEPEKKGIPTDEELVKAIESKNVHGYTKTGIAELKEQALQAPASFQNQFGDEATTVSLIAKNTTDQINKAIEYQQERLKDPDISEFEIEQIDGHIQLLEQGLKQRTEFFPDEANKPEEGKPLSKLEQLKAKRLLSKEEVPGETIDQKLKHISQQPEDFESDLVALAEKRFPKEPITEPEQSKPTDVVGSEVGGDKELVYGLVKNNAQATDVVFEKPYTDDKEYQGVLDKLEHYFKKDKGTFLRAYDKIVNPTRETRKGFAGDFYDKNKIIELEKDLSKFYASDFDKDIGGYSDYITAKEQSLSTKPEPVKNEEAKVDKVSKPAEKAVIAEAKPDKEVQPAEEVEPKIKDVNLDKEIGLLSAEFLEINKPEVTPGSQRIKIVDVPISSVSTDTSSFQNREEEYSQESVDRILNAVKEDTFNWVDFKQITLWKNNGQLYVLSGHSRLEAFKRLTKMGYVGFDTIPAEIFEGTKEQATAIALRSNTLATKETPIERANYYRDARALGTSSKAIAAEAKEYEGRNAPTIIALSYLNPRGNAIADLKAFGQVQEGDKSKANSLQMARWTGDVRQQFPQLTNEHENEIYKWLKDGAYAKIKNLAEISARINNVVSGFDFDPEKPLNLEHRATKTYADDHYEQQIADKEKQIKDQQKVIAEKQTKYNEANLSPQEVAEKLVPDNAILSRMQQDYIKLKNNKGAITEANKGILSLFDNIQTEIENGTITAEEATSFINNTDNIEEDDTIIEDIERNAESPDNAQTAIDEGTALIRGEDVVNNREKKAEAKLAEKVATLEKEKTSRINEVTKPEMNMQDLLINDLFTLAGTSEANHQEYNNIKDQFYALKNLFDCLFA